MIGPVKSAVPLLTIVTLISLVALVLTNPGLTDWKARFGVKDTFTEHVSSQLKVPLVVAILKVIV